MLSTTGHIALQQQHHIATVTIAHPGKRNALTVAMWNTLEQTFDRLSRDDALRCVVLQGEGDSFAAGADIDEFDQVRATRAQVAEFHERIVPGALRAIEECPVPVLALIRGACAGGGLEIAAACDLRIAGRSARLGVPVGRLGFSLAMGETAWLVRLAGPAVAAELLLEGRMLEADEACAKGLLTRVVDDALLAQEGSAAVQRIAESAPLAARAHKRQLRRLMRDASPVTPSERMASYAFADTEDYRIGMQAFRARSAPVFVGR